MTEKLTPKLWPLLERCIEEGLAIGYHRAHKHNDAPNEAEMCEAQRGAIVNEICEWFDLEGGAIE